MATEDGRRGHGQRNRWTAVRYETQPKLPLSFATVGLSLHRRGSNMKTELATRWRRGNDDKKEAVATVMRGRGFQRGPDRYAACRGDGLGGT